MANNHTYRIIQDHDTLDWLIQTLIKNQWATIYQTPDKADAEQVLKDLQR